MSYFDRAIVELALLSVLAGIAGVWILLRRRSLFAAALSHATFPGGVIAAALGANVLLGQAAAAAVLTVVMTLLSRTKHQGTQVASGVVLAFGFALGALLSSLQTAIRVPVDALLVGQVFGVSNSDLVVTAAAVAVTAVIVVMNWRVLMFDTFDPVGYRAVGGSALRAEIVTATLVAIFVVVAMPAVGAILAIALVVGPAATAALLVRNIRWVPPVATLVALLASGLGLFASWQFGVAAGGAIGLAVALLFLVAFMIHKLFRHAT